MPATSGLFNYLEERRGIAGTPYEEYLGRNSPGDGGSVARLWWLERQFCRQKEEVFHAFGLRVEKEFGSKDIPCQISMEEPVISLV